MTLSAQSTNNSEEDPVKKRFILCLFLDGLGISSVNEFNAVIGAKTPNISKYVRDFPVTLLSGKTKDPARRYFSLGTGILDDSDSFPQADTCLTEILSKNNYRQLKICASEQMIGWNLFFNNNKELSYLSEDRLCLNGPGEIKDLDDLLKNYFKLLKKAYQSDKYDFIVMSLALVHEAVVLGDFKETVRTIERIDKLLPKIIDLITADGGLVVLSSPYGNAERTRDVAADWEDKEPTDNPVPFVLIGQEYEGKTIGLADPIDGDLSVLAPGGSLADFAPSILSLLNIEKPKSMEGESLI
jgi:bisphosphoglycerate-independent phosphoglycerate mutase (AlkP superfamily)